MEPLVEKVLERLLREGGGGNFASLAVYVLDHGEVKQALLYDHVELLKLIGLHVRFKARVEDGGPGIVPTSLEHWVDMTTTGGMKGYISPDFVSDILWMLIDKGAMKGYIRIASPDSRARGPCNGAWEVTHAAGAGKGYGKALYGLGYALSPTGILMSDRKEVSDDAKGGWYKASKKAGRPRKRLDNIELPDTPPPEDDCVVHPDDADYLNFSYGKEGWEASHLRTLKTAHEETMTEVGPLIARYLIQALKASVTPFWGKYYFN